MSIHAIVMLVVAAILGSGSTTASAQQKSAEPAKLKEMRQIYSKELAKLKLPILKKLAADLGELEGKFTKENKLEEAIAARQERLKIETLRLSLQAESEARVRPGSTARPTSKPTAEMREFSIPMGNASLQGRLKRPASDSYITNWVVSSCEATWSGGQIIPGMYDVYIDFDTYWSRSGGQLKFEELNQDFHCVIPGGQKRKTMKVGTFRLGSALGFTIKANTKNRYGILRLHGVTFKPAAQQ
ncbi:MAG: hypothetical protein ACR2RV_00710 [Verrucomicrobiales bacterium]